MHMDLSSLMLQTFSYRTRTSNLDDLDFEVNIRDSSIFSRSALACAVRRALLADWYQRTSEPSKRVANP